MKTMDRYIHANSHLSGVFSILGCLDTRFFIFVARYM